MESKGLERSLIPAPALQKEPVPVPGVWVELLVEVMGIWTILEVLPGRAEQGHRFLG